MSRFERIDSIARDEIRPDAEQADRDRPALPKRWAQAIATAACTGIVIIAPGSIAPAARVTLVLLGTWGAIDLSRREAREPGDPRPIAWTIAGLFGLAVGITPKFGTDIWAYTMIGRILAVHHRSPYRVTPAAVSGDPLLHLLRHGWRYGTTPYGPLTVLHAAAVALIAGTNPLLYRLAFQGTAAAALGIALWLIWRATHSTAALALVGLHPEVAGSIVNGGHNEALVALGLVGVVLLLAHDRFRDAGWVLLVTILAKLTIAYAIIPLAVWTGSRHGRRALWNLLAPTIVAAPFVALIPGAVHSMTSANGDVVTRLAIWNLPLHVSWLAFPHLHAANYTTVGLVAVAAVIVFGSLRARKEPAPDSAAVVGAAAWVAMAGYVVAWYTVAGLVAAALRPTGRLARWLAVQGGVITAAFLIPGRVLATNAIVQNVVHVYVPVALTAGFVWALADRPGRAERPCA